MSTYTVTSDKKVTTKRLLQMKAAGEKIAMITAYDFTVATLVDQAGVDMILVGDSASNVMQGNATTLTITLEEMIVYGRSVARAARRAMVVVDMPFGSYQGDPVEAQRNAVRIMRETGADAVKLEGGSEMQDAISMILRAGIPVVGHLGLTPQSVNKFGGYGLQAATEEAARKLESDAHLLDKLGCCAIVFEKIPAELASRVSPTLQAPVIGIGAGSGTDGQVLVFQDIMGMNQGFKPKFLRRYANIGEQIIAGVNHYVADVKAVEFPNTQEQY